MNIIGALWLRNLKIFVRDRVQLILTIIIPFFFLFIFSAIFKNENISNPVNYMLAGIVIAIVFQASLTMGTSTVEDIVSGFMKEVLVSPVKRIQIAIGQLLSAATVACLQGILILIVGFFIGLRFEYWITPLAVIGIMIIVGLVFSGLGLLIATLVKNSQTFQIVNTAITIPLTFLSGAYIPLSLLPDILRYVAYLNPMTYTTAFFRTVILERTSLTIDELIAEQLAFKIGDFAITPLISMAIILIFGFVFLILASLVFAKVDFSKINRSKNKEVEIDF